jgi:ABC-2 type transport system permease protein
MLAAMHIAVPLPLLALAVAYFVVGYLFYGSMMVGIGGITNNMREAQQFSIWFTFANFAPMIAIWPILSRPGGPLAIALSMFPPTASTTMLLRLAVPNSQVPPWQVAVSLALLAGTAWITLQFSARVFRIGMLLYGKTPNLPEILRWVRQR